MEALIEVLGKETASRAAKQHPQLLSVEAGLLNDVLAALVQVIGPDKAVQVCPFDPKFGCSL
jgi:hypothetical protein